MMQSPSMLMLDLGVSRGRVLEYLPEMMGGRVESPEEVAEEFNEYFF